MDNNDRIGIIQLLLDDLEEQAPKQRLSHKQKLAQAQAFTTAGLARVENHPKPNGQIFTRGTRVIIGHGEWHSGRLATVQYSYAHAYGGNDVKNYCLDIDGVGKVSWYHENSLTAA